MPDDARENETPSDTGEPGDTESTTTPIGEEPSTANNNQLAPDAPTADPKRIVEAVLMAAESPLTPGKIASIIEAGTGRDIKKHIQALNADYDELGLSFRIEEVAGGFQILTRPQYNHWLTKLLRVRQETKLSPAAMETLAIVAYKQPCTRAEVEAIRGVAAGEMINRLREMNIVKIAGRAEDLGRPLLYGTTKKFLEVFGLPSLEDLPQVEALRPPSKKVEKTEADDTIESESMNEDIDSTHENDIAAERPDVEAAEVAEESPALHIVHEEDEDAAITDKD
ncbi:MAG: SMC-Scp complex subunit ScpB [Phycisphaerales bacterium]|nr:SMC-Scp complex subunit ScpB [Phycisphaerales bacterium]MCB9862401.1 SMC-Scp complex subunit ScpB [Phycisphaerales bacterium]